MEYTAIGLKYGEQMKTSNDTKKVAMPKTHLANVFTMGETSFRRTWFNSANWQLVFAFIWFRLILRSKFADNHPLSWMSATDIFDFLWYPFMPFLWAWQRATRGYADPDHWNYCDFLGWNIYHNLQKLIDHAHLPTQEMIDKEREGKDEKDCFPELSVDQLKKWQAALVTIATIEDCPLKDYTQVMEQAIADLDDFWSYYTFLWD